MSDYIRHRKIRTTEGALETLYRNEEKGAWMLKSANVNGHRVSQIWYYPDEQRLSINGMGSVSTAPFLWSVEIMRMHESGSILSAAKGRIQARRASAIVSEVDFILSEKAKS